MSHQRPSHLTESLMHAVNGFYSWYHLSLSVIPGCLVDSKT
jgi:hypothetical protein